MAGLQLRTAVRYIRGVGPTTSGQFEQAGIHTVLDLLYCRPGRHRKLPGHKPLSDCHDGELACVAGEIIRVRSASGGRPRVVADIQDGHERCRVTWFNLPRLRSQLEVGMFICATGKLRASEDDGAELTNPTFRCFRDIDDMELPQEPRWQAHYPRLGALDSPRLARIIRACLEDLDDYQDYLPGEIRAERELPAHRTALRHLHLPPEEDSLEHGRRRLAYDELLIWQLEFARARAQRQRNGSAPQLKRTEEMDRRIRRRLPFELTEAQNRCIEEICGDLDATRPMLRLLQGDVGAGKTAVALYATLVCVANHRQTALLAPTEVLARQHFEKLSRALRGSRVRLGLAVGGLPAADRRTLREDLRNGRLDVVIGTHALLERPVRFSRLGLLIIDEQHRFGVNQRLQLLQKNRAGHYLVISATPIPRTQALAMVGDLDLSILDELPAGDRRVNTQLVLPSRATAAWAEIRRALDQGNQAFVVLPLVDQSDKLPLRAVNAEIERLRAHQLQGYRCAALHGRMPAAQQAEVIAQFRRKDIQVLVCTTVVEVGIDIPGANVMAVFHPERFGLAQLHQLRGRIGRSGAQAALYLLLEHADSKARERLEVLCRSTDGFEVADADLRLRGPGEIVGLEQHGLPMYRFADLITDGALLRAAQQDARSLLAGRVSLNAAQQQHLSLLRNRYVRTPGQVVHVA